MAVALALKELTANDEVRIVPGSRRSRCAGFDDGMDALAHGAIRSGISAIFPSVSPSASASFAGSACSSFHA